MAAWKKHCCSSFAATRGRRRPKDRAASFNPDDGRGVPRGVVSARAAPALGDIAPQIATQVPVPLKKGSVAIRVRKRLALSTGQREKSPDRAIYKSTSPGPPLCFDVPSGRLLQSGEAFEGTAGRSHISKTCGR